MKTPYRAPRLHFRELNEKQLLALAIGAEEEDQRIYSDFAQALRAKNKEDADFFVDLAKDESRHRHQLIEKFRRKFGEYIPLIRRTDVDGFIQRRPLWIDETIKPEKAREEAASMESESRRFYLAAAESMTDAGVRQLLGDLAQEEQKHEEHASSPPKGPKSDATARRDFVLQIVQPGLAGLMDGSVSTLAPLFAAAFATANTVETFRVGLAASVGAGISMGFAEALSDDGKVSGRGAPLARGVICGLMTTFGGIGHTLPYLISSFNLATTIAMSVVLVELAVISWIRNRYMDTPPLSAALQVFVGGILVFLAGWWIGVG